MIELTMNGMNIYLVLLLQMVQAALKPASAGYDPNVGGDGTWHYTSNVGDRDGE